MKTITKNGIKYKLVKVTKPLKAVKTPATNLEYLKAKGYKLANVTETTYKRKTDGVETKLLKADLITEQGNVPVMINAFSMWRV